MEEEKKMEEKPKEEELQEEKPQEEKPKEMRMIIFTSKENESCQPAVQEAKALAEESKIELVEIDIADLDFPKEVMDEGGGVPTTCMVSSGKLECHIGFGPEYKQKLLELMRKLRERIESKSE